MSTGSTRQQRYRKKKNLDSRPVNFYLSQEVHEKFANLRQRSKRADLCDKEKLTLDLFFTIWVNAVTEVVENCDSEGKTVSKIAEDFLEVFDLRADTGVRSVIFLDIYKQLQGYFPEEFALSPKELDRYVSYAASRPLL